MATTRLSNVIIPELYMGYTAVNSPEKTAFFESGLVVRNGMLDQKANTGGEQINIPFWRDLDSSVAPNLGNTNPADLAVPNIVTAGKQVGQMAYLNQAYSTADLTGEIAGSSPMQQIRNRFGTYWMRQWQRRLVSTTKGIIADNVANNAGDMVVNVASESIAGQSAATKFSLNNFVDATHTMGDMYNQLSAIAVHSGVHKQMVINNDIVYIPDSEGRLTIPTYMGLRVIIDDGLPVQAGTTDGVKYTSYIYGSGAFGFGEGSAENPVEVERQALQGKGAGVEIIIERKSWILHPFGFTVATQGAAETGAHTLAELENAATWSRVIDRKLVPLCSLVTN